MLQNPAVFAYASSLTTSRRRRISHCVTPAAAAAISSPTSIADSEYARQERSLRLRGCSVFYVSAMLGFERLWLLVHVRIIRWCRTTTLYRARGALASAMKRNGAHLSKLTVPEALSASTWLLSSSLRLTVRALLCQPADATLKTNSRFSCVLACAALPPGCRSGL